MRVPKLILLLLAVGIVPALGAPPQPQVTYFSAGQVKAAFDKGETLYNGGVNFRIEASRSDHAGEVEVHTLDTDVIYVLQGTTTFVTGGTMVDGKAIAPNEIRGASIEGGNVRHLAKGDVIVVPAGVPHWFREVPAPFSQALVHGIRHWAGSSRA